MPTVILLNIRVFQDTTLPRLYIFTDVSEELSRYRVSSSTRKCEVKYFTARPRKKWQQASLKLRNGFISQKTWNFIFGHLTLFTARPPLTVSVLNTLAFHPAQIRTEDAPSARVKGCPADSAPLDCTVRAPAVEHSLKPWIEGQYGFFEILTQRRVRISNTVEYIALTIKGQATVVTVVVGTHAGSKLFHFPQFGPGQFSEWYNNSHPSVIVY